MIRQASHHFLCYENYNSTLGDFSNVVFSVDNTKSKSK